MARILVAEDDPTIAEMIRDVLTDEGYSVVHARDGIEALERAAEERFDLVIVDLMMPRMDGRGLRAALAGDPGTARLPVILMSATSNLLSVDRASFAGVLAKPFHLDALSELVARHAVLRNEAEAERG
jgi:two-component system, OmpR family, alkaline phosphatase synthesis response regulator PhoP